MASRNSSSPSRRKPNHGSAAVETPIAIRSRVPLDAELRAHVAERLQAVLDGAAQLFERATVWFDNVDAARGTADTECRIRLVREGHPGVAVAARAEDPRAAFVRAAPSIARAARQVEAEAHADGAKATASPSEARAAGMVDALESSTTRPSRTSTRRSANRIKSATQLTRRTKRAVRSPQARAARG